MTEAKQPTIYERLLEAVDKLPKEAIERASKEVTRKGYDTTGYQYQFLVNVFNEVLGIGNWGFKYSLVKEIEGTWSNGKGYYEITAEVTVWIATEGVTKAEMTCVGGHKAEMYADALKGAITNGFKKTVSFFGVGKKAYEGTIDEDYRPVPQTPKDATLATTDTPICPACNKPQTLRKNGNGYYCSWKYKNACPPRQLDEAEKKFMAELDETATPWDGEIPVINEK